MLHSTHRKLYHPLPQPPPVNNMDPNATKGGHNVREGGAKPSDNYTKE